MTPSAHVLFAFKRLRARIFFIALLVLCFSLTIAMVVCIPAFAGAVGRGIIREHLSQKSKSLNRPLFSVRFYAIPTSLRPMTLDDVAHASDWLADMLVRHVGLPLKALYVQSESPSLRMRPRPGDTHYTAGDIVAVRVACVQNIDKHVQATQGLPFGTTNEGDQLSVWVLSSFADEMGLRVGEAYHLAYSFIADSEPIRFKIEGFCEAIDPHEPFWYADPRVLLQGTLLTTVEQYQAHVTPVVTEGTGFDFWYYVLDDARMNLDRAQDYIQGLEHIERQVEKHLPRGRMDYAPTEELDEGRERKWFLATLLLSLSLPVMGMLALFMGLVSAAIARSQVRETAILMSRGASRSQILGLICLESLLILLLACPLGVILGLHLARLLGLSKGFLSFVHRAPLEVHPASVNCRLVGLAILTCLASRLLATGLATRFSVVTYERHVARRIGTRGVVRILLLALLAATTAYAHSRLVQRGTLGQIGALPWGDPTRDPLLLLTPSLFLLTASLAGTELFTILLRPLALLGRHLCSAVGHLACVRLGRGGHRYRAPTYMLVLCLGMGAFYASLAKSADMWLVDRLRYQVGADVTFNQGLVKHATGDISDLPTWLPLSEYEEIPGVANITRVGEFPADVPFGQGIPKLRLLAVQRTEFPRVAYFRSDFSDRSLGELMNRLAMSDGGILLPEDLAARLHLGEEDGLPLDLRLEDDWYRVRFKVAGTFRYFPTMSNSEEEPVVVTSLEYLQRQIGSLPHGMWLRLEPGISGRQIVDDVERLRVFPLDVRDLGQLITDSQQRLERVGIFGTLSVSFVAGALLATAALLIHSVASVGSQAYRLAVVRAIGMNKGQVIALISVEYLVTVLYSMAAGASIGLIGAELYVPFFPLTLSTERPVPPFIPQLDWEKAAWLGIGMAVVLVALGGVVLWRMARTKLFEALRLGVRE